MWGTEGRSFAEPLLLRKVSGSHNQVWTISVDILIIDSNTLVRQVIHNCLTHMRYAVGEAADGQTGWELLRQTEIPLLITAWPVPGINSKELLSEIRTRNSTFYTYTILLGKRTDQAALIEGLRAGADDYLIKPLHLKELRRRVMLGRRIHKLESRQRQLQQDYNYAIMLDPLTRVLNRQTIYERLETELINLKHAGHPFSLMLLELDQLTTLNERYGYQSGDRALQLVASTLERIIRQHDAVGRWGGSKFLLIITQTTMQATSAIGERIRRQIAAIELPLPDGQTHALSASVGMMLIPRQKSLPRPELVMTVEKALAQAKQAGGITLIQLP